MSEKTARSFMERLLSEISSDQDNDFEDNYDYYRFGKVRKMVTTVGLFKKVVKKILSKGNLYHAGLINSKNVINRATAMGEYLDRFALLYDLLDDDRSKELLIKILAYRIMGHTKVKLPLNNPSYWKGIKQMERLTAKSEKIPLDFNNWSLSKINLYSLGYPIVCYTRPTAANIIWLVRSYEGGQEKRIRINPGDVVIDGGACWGDTALRFAYDAGEEGKIYCFEINQKNLAVMEKNLSLNPEPRRNIEVMKTALWSESSKKLHFSDSGPASRIEVASDSIDDNMIAAISIDDFIEKYKVGKVDFIKMDIEGAELNALKGAEKTIRKFKPKLAISLYHSLDDFVNIPQLVKKLNKEYKLYLGHFSIHAEETVLFAA